MYAYYHHCFTVHEDPNRLALNAVISTAGELISAHCCVGALIDNMALISRIQTWHHQGSGGTLRPEYDLLQVAKGIMAKHKLVVKPEHIKSHQDNDTEYDKLPWKAQLNCDCDLLQVAKGIMAKHKLVVKPEHIKSHQDNDTLYDKFPWKAQLN